MMGDSFQVKPILDAAWRRRWLILIPPIVGTLVSWGWVRKIPSEYRAETTIRVVAQKVPKEILQSTVTAGAGEQIGSLKVQILSATYLNDVVKQIGMVPDDAGLKQVEDARTDLKRRIEITLDEKRFSWFKIAVRHENSRLAAKAANRLAQLFIEENSKLRTAQASGTEGLVGEMKSRREADLDAAEDRLAQYKRQHQGELPEQQAANQTLINTYQTQIQGLNDQIRNRQGEIEMLRAQSDATDAIAGIVGLPGVGGDPVLRGLQTAKGELEQLMLKYSDQHPDVRRKRAEVEQLEAQYQKHVAAGAGGEGDATIPANASPTEVRIALAQREIRECEQKRAELQAKVDVLVAKVRNAPLVEVELNEILRAYNEAKASYDDLRKRGESAEQGRELEESGQGEQFHVQEKAWASTTPAYPDVPTWIFGGLLAGLALGGGIAFLLEFFDPSMRSEESFRLAFPDVPLLASIPTLPGATRTVNQKHKRRGKGNSKSKRTAAAMAVVGPALSATLLQLAGRFPL